MPDAVAELGIHYRVQGVDCTITHHFWQSGSAEPNLFGLLTSWQGDPQAAFLACMPTDVELLRLTALHVAGTSEPSLSGREELVNEPGTRTGALGDALPPSLCQVHTIRTGLRGRRRRGRNFWSGGLEDDIDPGGFKGGAGYFGSLVNAYYTELFVAYFSDVDREFSWVVFSRKTFETTGWDGAIAVVTQQVGHAQVHELRSRRS